MRATLALAGSRGNHQHADLVAIGNGGEFPGLRAGAAIADARGVPALHERQLTLVLADLDRLAHWVGREEPRRAELWTAVDDIKECLRDGTDLRRPILRCAVAVRGLWSTALKRPLDRRVRELFAIVDGEAHHAA